MRSSVVHRTARRPCDKIAKRGSRTGTHAVSNVSGVVRERLGRVVSKSRTNTKDTMQSWYE